MTDYRIWRWTIGGQFFGGLKVISYELDISSLSNGEPHQLVGKLRINSILHEHVYFIALVPSFLSYVNNSLMKHFDLRNT